MKILVVPDIHQTEYYKKFIKDFYDTVDKIVFLGDYFDTHTPKDPNVVPTEKAIENFEEIVYMAKTDDKVDALGGNHDFEYITDDRTNTYQYVYCKKIERVLRKNIDLLKVAVEYDDYVFSHAGISINFLSRFGMVEENDGILTPKKDTIEQLNRKLIKEGGDFLSFSPFDRSGYGESTTSSPIWIRPRSLLADAAFKKQVVGHTAVGENKTVFLERKHNKVIFTDTDEKNIPFVLDTKKEYSFSLE